MADADTHSSMTSIFAQLRVLWLEFRSKYSIKTARLARLSVHLTMGYLRYFDMGRNFSVISGIPFGIRPIELYDDWRIDISSDRMVELIGTDLPRLVEPSSATPALSVSRRWFSLQAPDLSARFRAGCRMYDDMCDLNRGHGKLSGTFYFWEAEVGLMTTRLQGWIQADPDFQRSDALSQRRVVLSHPILRRYYLGERVDIQIRGCRSVPYPPLEDMRVGKQMTLTAAHTEGIPHLEFIMGGDYDEFCGISLMPPIGSRLDNLQSSFPAARDPFFSGFGSLD
ncbi:hypothetical protein JCGZ_05121 [Jatropha curcas]|uniref:Aminotransferase-like plant mobile domain-containing protein n=1 Tax=Jatropha curcas TaxID=180498 RepID=A0A067L2S1_JATCU|nr:hypothetical protein JCGZ_05121 [Jatropha curcas]